MSKPESFILTTDFATLKNDAAGSTSVTAPGSVAIAANAYAEYHADISIGSQGALTRLQMSSSKDSNTIRPCRTLSLGRIGSTATFPGTAGYTLTAFVYRPSANTLRCQIMIGNPFSETLTTEAGSETITYYINTFIAPYA